MSSGKKPLNPMEIGFNEGPYKKFRDGVNGLGFAFEWRKTPQGHVYWSDLIDHVRELDELFARYMVEKGDE